MKLKKGAYELILEGRTPGAVARLSGGVNGPELSGNAEFYATPLGIVVCAEISGLPIDKRSEIFGLCIGDEETAIYSKAGSAWCAVMTRHQSVSDVVGKTLTVRKDRKSSLGQGTICASCGAAGL